MIYTKNRRPRHKIFTVGLLVIVTLFVSTMYIWRNRPIKGYSPKDVAAVASAKKIFDRAAPVSAADAEGMATALAQAPTIPDQLYTVTPSPDQRSALVDMIAQWIKLNHDVDADGYIDFMTSHGFTLSPDSARLVSFQAVKPKYRKNIYSYFANGEPMPESMSEEEYFKYVFTHYLHTENDRLLPISLATGPDSAMILYQRTDDSYTSLQLWPNNDRWTAGGTMGSVQFWAPPTTIHEIVRRDGDALRADVHLPLKNKRGEWILLTMNCYWDPSRLQWQIWYTLKTNSLFDHLNYVF